MKELFKSFREMGQDFRKMGEELAKGAEDLAEGAAQIFEGFDPIFKSSTSTMNWSTGEKGGKEWAGRVTVDGDSFVLRIPVPGKAPTDLDVRVFANKVRVKVEGPKASEKHDYELPQQIDPKQCTAQLHRGVLTLRVLKTGIETTGTPIEVKETTRL